jgi:hypothetical protein
VGWVLLHLVVRTDVYGGQFKDRQGAVRRVTRRGLTRQALLKHFRAGVDASPEDVIGLHCTAPNETCRWAAIDIDRHDDTIDPTANFRFARRILKRATRAGLTALLVDSSGGTGGFHVFILFKNPVPMADAHRLARYLARGHEKFGLPRPPDLFPRNYKLTGKLCGHWLRLFGRHHKRPTWARVWCPVARRWLKDDEAVAAILATEGTDVDIAAIVPADFGVEPRRARAAVAADAPRPDSPAHRRLVRRARAALDHLAEAAPELAEDYHQWLKVGMALKELGPDGLDLWHEFSMICFKYMPEVLDEKWQSFQEPTVTHGVGLGSLFHMATEEGWDGSVVDEDDWCVVDRRPGGGPRTFSVTLKDRPDDQAGEGANR